MRKKMIGILVLCFILLNITSVSFAVSDEQQNYTENLGGPVGYYIWTIKSVTNLSNKYTSFRTVASHLNPVNNPNGFSLTYGKQHTWYNEISGSVEVSKSHISSAVGYNIGRSTTEYVQGEILIPKDFCGLIKLREVYINRKRVEQQQKHSIWGTWYGTSKYCTTEKFGWYDLDDEVWFGL